MFTYIKVNVYVRPRKCHWGAPGSRPVRFSFVYTTRLAVYAHSNRLIRKVHFIPYTQNYFKLLTYYAPKEIKEHAFY